MLAFFFNYVIIHSISLRWLLLVRLITRKIINSPVKTADDSMQIKCFSFCFRYCFLLNSYLFVSVDLPIRRIGSSCSILHILVWFHAYYCTILWWLGQDEPILFLVQSISCWTLGVFRSFWPFLINYLTNFFHLWTDDIFFCPMNSLVAVCLL